ncbi:unnamed protein product [Chondrus crispus]|uniref:Uncharacterized protein n=1 Tax=Chondrus crispus TaxID=2769 RepID=R7QTD1_CHOCR|nr:unnamed protein product [Chondrus crispus]CDF41379.1 unnamed protein product [Chondrus crispus]|eukprot:XP_005711673.1 unnamed protein product [Chondrus crispus]
MPSSPIPPHRSRNTRLTASLLSASCTFRSTNSSTVSSACPATRFIYSTASLCSQTCKRLPSAGITPCALGFPSCARMAPPPHTKASTSLPGATFAPLASSTACASRRRAR